MFIKYINYDRADTEVIIDNMKRLGSPLKHYYQFGGLVWVLGDSQHNTFLRTYILRNEQCYYETSEGNLVRGNISLKPHTMSFNFETKQNEFAITEYFCWSEQLYAEKYPELQIHRIMRGIYVTMR